MPSPASLNLTPPSSADPGSAAAPGLVGDPLGSPLRPRHPLDVSRKRRRPSPPPLPAPGGGRSAPRPRSRGGREGRRTARPPNPSGLGPPRSPLPQPRSPEGPADGSARTGALRQRGVPPHAPFPARRVLSQDPATAASPRSPHPAVVSCVSPPPRAAPAAPRPSTAPARRHPPPPPRLPAQSGPRETPTAQPTVPPAPPPAPPAPSRAPPRRPPPSGPAASARGGARSPSRGRSHLGSGCEEQRGGLRRWTGFPLVTVLEKEEFLLKLGGKNQTKTPPKSSSQLPFRESDGSFEYKAIVGAADVDQSGSK